MNRQKQRCPYCGKGMSYFSAYSSRRKAEYVCPKCGKESKVVIAKLIVPIFIIAAVIALAVMGLWFFFRMLSNPLGIVLVAAPLLIFLAISPKFVQLEPLKKYQKSMEAKKAGIEFSDNLTALDFDEEVSSMENSIQFKINSDLFNQIKSSRKSKKEQNNGKDLLSNSISGKQNPEAEAIPNVSGDHAGTATYPLKKLKNEVGKKVGNFHHKKETAPEDEVAAAKRAQKEQEAAAKKAQKEQDAAKKKAKKEKKAKENKISENNQYSANRRF